MPSFNRVKVLLGLTLLSTGPVAAVTCSRDKPFSLCCLGVAPFFTNAAVWGGICGYTPSSQNELIGGRCIQSTGSCPSGSIATCCAGRVPGPSGQCGLGTNCGTPSSSPPTLPPTLPPIVPAPIPSDWTTDFACSSDPGQRVLANAVVTQLSTNTPSVCINYCFSQDYRYAGVEYSNECHCGTGYKTSPAPASIDPSNCNMRCTGNNAYTCGGSFAVQLYRGPAAQDNFPAGWSQVHACAVDVPSRVLDDVVITRLSDCTPGKCAAHCAGLGYAFAGVEDRNECHCGSGVKEDIVVAPASECDAPCAGSKGLTCGGAWRIQIYGRS